MAGGLLFGILLPLTRQWLGAAVMGVASVSPYVLLRMGAEMDGLVASIGIGSIAGLIWKARFFDEQR